MKIILDAMSGDHAPGEIVKGALLAHKDGTAEIILAGVGEQILEALRENGQNELPKGIEIAHASQIVTMEDNAATAMREKRDSSIAVGLNLLDSGAGDAFVCAGNTGALLSGATLQIKRIKGIRRAALAPVVPTAAGGALLIDSGANVDCTPEYLLQFAFMGSYYARKVMNRPSPRVGLLNIGVEEAKGTELQKQAYVKLKEAHENDRINFIGNIEGRDVALGAADVVVCDGFSGNVLLKTMEGVGMFFAGEMKKLFMKSALTKLAAAMVQSGLTDFKKMLDYAEVGGAPLLGISKPVIKAHGSSNAKAIYGAVRQARLFAETELAQDIAANIEYMCIDE